MKTTGSKMINALYWCFNIGFVAHIGIVAFSFYMYASPKVINSEVRISPFNFLERQNFDTIAKHAEHAKTIVTKMTNAHAVVKYDAFSSMEAAAMLVFFLNTLHQLLWLAFTYCLLLIFRSLKFNAVFDPRNIMRLRLVALIVGLSPLLQLVKNILFASVLRNQVSYKSNYIAYYYDYSLLSGFFYMTVILVLVEVFRYGMLLKHENDLTV